MDNKKLLAQARKRFEDLCKTTGREYKLNDFDLDKWTLRDFVSECQYEADMRSEDLHDQYDRAEYNRYKRFVNSYKDKIQGIPAHEKHISNYDKMEPVQREVERWVTFHGRRIPIFKKDNMSPTIRGIKKPTGKPELTGFGSYNGKPVKYVYDDYPDKASFKRDLKANAVKRASVLDKQDMYILDHSNYRSMNNITGEYRKLMQRVKYAQAHGHDEAAKLFKSDADSLKSIIDEAKKIYLPKTKRYKFKR